MTLTQLINYLQEIEDSMGGHRKVYFTAINFHNQDTGNLPEDILYFNKNPYSSNMSITEENILYKDK